MKICYIGDAQSIHMQRWVKWFADRGHEVHLITDKPAEIENVKIHLMKERGKKMNFLIRAWQRRRLVKKIKPDILHAHYVLGYGFFGAFSGFHPFVVTAWGGDVLIEQWKIENTAYNKPFLKWIFKHWVKYVLRKADIVHIGATMMKKHIINLGGSKEKIVMVPFGVDLSQFSPKVSSKEVRENLGLEEGPAVISTRSLKKIYDIKTLIMAVPLVLKKVPNAKFIIGGSGGLKKALKS